jgi:hypothetical protein
VETGETQDSNPNFNELLDQWIAVVDSHEAGLQAIREALNITAANIQATHNHRRCLITTLGSPIHGREEPNENSRAGSQKQTPSEASTNPDGSEISRKRGRAAIETERDLAFIDLAKSLSTRSSWQIGIMERIESLENQQREISQKLENQQREMSQKLESFVDIINVKLDTLLTRLH